MTKTLTLSLEVVTQHISTLLLIENTYFTDGVRVKDLCNLLRNVRFLHYTIRTLSVKRDSGNTTKPGY